MSNAAKKTEVVARGEERPDPQTALMNPNPMTMIQYALENNFEIERIDRIMEMERRWKADKAREAFYQALAEWKKEPITVIKDKKNSHYGNTYTSIGNQVNTVNASMAPHGLSTDWELEQGEGRIKVTCTMTHTLGHSRSATLSAPPDSSGSKNALQQIKSTVTYLELATHQAVTGVVAVDAANLDDDGNEAGLDDPITFDQKNTLEQLMRETGTATAAFLGWIGAEKLELIRAKDFNRAMTELNRKKRAMAAKEPKA